MVVLDSATHLYCIQRPPQVGISPFRIGGWGVRGAAGFPDYIGAAVGVSSIFFWEASVAIFRASSCCFIDPWNMRPAAIAATPIITPAEKRGVIEPTKATLSWGISGVSAGYCDRRLLQRLGRRQKLACQVRVAQILGGELLVLSRDLGEDARDLRGERVDLDRPEDG